MKKLVASLISIISLLTFSVSTSFAQGQTIAPNSLDPDDTLVSPDVESCFSYYQYGKVRVNLATDKARYGTGEQARVIGTLLNDNTFPVLDSILFAHLVRINTTGTFAQSGHFLVDRIPLLTDLNFLPGESKTVKLDLPILQSYPSGEYQLQFFIFSKEGFYYAGRPFVEEDIAGLSNFSVRNDSAPHLYLDPQQFSVNGEAHQIREQITEFDAL